MIQYSTWHLCTRCHKPTECRACSQNLQWACPWINGDEEALCEECEHIVAEQMEEFERL